MTFVKHHKHHFGAFIILIAIVIVSGYFAFGTPDDNISTPQQNNTTTQTVDDTIQDTNNKTQNAINKTQITEDTKVNPTTTPDVKDDSQQFNNLAILQLNNPITIHINGEDYQTKFTPSTTVLDAMNALKSENKLSFSGKEYPGMGMFVEEINGVKNDNLAGKYWIYYVNGQSAQVGISNYIIKPEDKIEWKYENTNL